MEQHWKHEWNNMLIGCILSSLIGPIPLSTYMRIYKKGDIVDIKVRCQSSLFFYCFKSAVYMANYSVVKGYMFSEKKEANFQAR